MQNNLSINNIPNNIKAYSPSTEQQISKEIRDYFEAEKLPVNQNTLSENIKNLLSKELTIKNFLKNTINSTNSKDALQITNILKTFNLESLQELTPNLPNQMNKLLNQNLTQIQQNNTFINNSPKIEVTSPEVHIMAITVLGLVKEGKLKEAHSSLNNKSDVLEKIIDLFLSQSSQTARETANLLNFIQNVISQGLAMSPELQKMLEEKYKKLEKYLSFSSELALQNEEDIDTLSEQAQEFVKKIMNLRQQLEFMDEATTEDVITAYEKLLELIGATS